MKVVSGLRRDACAKSGKLGPLIIEGLGPAPPDERMAALEEPGVDGRTKGEEAVTLPLSTSSNGLGDVLLARIEEGPDAAVEDMGGTSVSDCDEEDALVL